MNLQNHSYSKCKHSLLPPKRKKDKGRLECHEKGWLNIFQLLTLDDFTTPGSNDQEEIFTYNLYVGQNPNGQFATKLNNGVSPLGPSEINCSPFPLSLNFKGLLNLVDQMDSSEMNLNSFMSRFSEIQKVSQSDINLFIKIIDPTNTENITPYYCTPPYI